MRFAEVGRSALTVRPYPRELGCSDASVSDSSIPGRERLSGPRLGSSGSFCRRRSRTGSIGDTAPRVTEIREQPLPLCRRSGRFRPGSSYLCRSGARLVSEPAALCLGVG